MIQKHNGGLGDQQQAEKLLNPKLSEGMNGYIKLGDGETWTQTITSPIRGLQDIIENQVLSVSYRLPDAHKHISKLAVGVIIPEKTIKEQDIKGQRPWHEQPVNQSPLERPPVPGSISGPELVTAAHRLLMPKNSSIIEQSLNLLKEKAKQGSTPSTFERSIPGKPLPLGSQKKSSKSRRVPAGPPGYEGGFSPAQIVASTNKTKTFRGLQYGGSPHGLDHLPTSNAVFSIHQLVRPLLPLGEPLSQKTKLHERLGVHALCKGEGSCPENRHQPGQFSRLKVNFLVRCRRILW